MIQITQTQHRVYEAYKQYGTIVAVWTSMELGQVRIKRTLLELVEAGLAIVNPKNKLLFIMLDIPYQVLPDPLPHDEKPMDTGIVISETERVWMLNEYPNSEYQRNRRLAVKKLREMGFRRTKTEINNMACMLGVNRIK